MILSNILSQCFKAKRLQKSPFIRTLYRSLPLRFRSVAFLSKANVSFQLVCSQTLYLLFKDRRERVIKNKLQGIY